MEQTESELALALEQIRTLEQALGRDTDEYYQAVQSPEEKISSSGFSDNSLQGSNQEING